MTYKTHVAMAMTIAIPIVNFTIFNESDRIPFLIFVAVGALAPDLDEEGSYLSRKLPVVPMFFKLFGVTHRGITHRAISVLFLLCVIFTFYFLDKSFEEHVVFYCGFVLGYVMHLLGDMMTKGGINNFFFPVSAQKAVLMPRAFRFYTGSVQEYLVLLLFLGSIFLEIYLFKGSSFGIF